MRIPVIRGLIERRILVNYRVDPDILVSVLPNIFRPKLVNGMGMAGVCLIRLKNIRPWFLPAFTGISSENAAHRIAVEWDENGETREGVFVPRRDTSSRLNTLLGGRLFPGMHNHASFHVQEGDGGLCVELTSDDKLTHLLVEGKVVEDLPATSVFETLSDASQFYERGSLGYSATTTPGQFDGLELHTFNWHVRPLDVTRVKSSFFDDQKLFPAGSVNFDCALVMHAIEHEWHAKKCLCLKSGSARTKESPQNVR
jgi:hypothetical protein